MAVIENEELAKRILDFCGGAKNIINAANCMTRLRLVVSNEHIVKIDEIKKLMGVLSVLSEGTSIQVVLGPGKARKVAEEFNNLLNIALTAEQEIELAKEQAEKAQEKPITGNKFVRIFKYIGRFFKNIKWRKGFKHIGNIFSPLVPGFIMFGVLFSISCIIQMIGGHGDPKVDPTTFAGATKAFYYIFYCTSKGFIAYLSILVGVNAAKEFKVTPVVGAAIGGLAIFEPIIEIAKCIPGWSWVIGAGTANPITKGIIMAGNGGVLAVILAVFLIGFLERWIKKWMPDVLDNIFTPILTILVGAVGFLFIIMPVMGFVMSGLTQGISLLTDPNMNIAVKLIVGFLLGGLFLPTVMLGLHRGFDSIYVEFMNKQPFTGVPIYPVFAMADAAQAGAGIALWLKGKKYNHKRVEQNALAGIVPQILGVSEPLVYGVTLPLVKPFITVGIGAGIGGAFIMAMGINSTAYAASGLMAIPMMTWVNGVFNPGKGIGCYVAGWAISVISAFIATWFMISEKDLAKMPKE